MDADYFVNISYVLFYPRVFSYENFYVKHVRVGFRPIISVFSRGIFHSRKKRQRLGTVKFLKVIFIFYKFVNPGEIGWIVDLPVIRQSDPASRGFFVLFTLIEFHRSSLSDRFRCIIYSF